MTDKEYMQIAFDEAFSGIRSNKGGPFGAVIVLDGVVVGKGCNMVTSTNDPTAHAEVVAIRNTCKVLGRFHLSSAVLYATCEPCPMCLSAIYWAGISAVYYCLTKIDAANIDFQDKFIYDELEIPPEQRTIPFRRINFGKSQELFSEWTNKQDKIQY